MVGGTTRYPISYEQWKDFERNNNGKRWITKIKRRKNNLNGKTI